MQSIGKTPDGEMNCCDAQIVECLVLPRVQPCVHLDDLCCQAGGAVGGGGRDPLLKAKELRDKPLPANGSGRAGIMQPSAGTASSRTR